jgi:hypothetical protein
MFRSYDHLHVIEIEGIAGYVSVFMQLYCMLVFIVFHYIAIFRRVGFFIYLFLYA